MKKVPTWIWLVAWCVFGILLRIAPSSVVLNHPSSATDYWVALSGAWALHCGVPIHSMASCPIGVAFFIPYEFVSWMFGMNGHTVGITQSGLFTIVSVISFFVLRPRFGACLTMIGTAYFSLFATSPGNMGDSIFMTYEGIGYDYLPIALAQLAVVSAICPRTNRRDSLDGILTGTLLAWAFLIKPNLAVAFAGIIVAGLILLQVRNGYKFYFDGVFSFAVLSLAVIVLNHIDLAAWFADLKRASAVRGFQIMTITGEQYRNGNMTWGISAIYSKVINRLNGNIIEWLPGIVLLSVGAMKMKRVELVVFFGLYFAVDAMQPVFNSVAMTSGFLWLLGVFFLKDELAAGLLKVIFSICTLLWLGRLIVFFSFNCMAPAHFPEQSPNYPFTGSKIPGNFSNIYFQRAGADTPGHDFADSIKSAITLLKEHDLQNKAILDFDFVNPFPMILNTAYPIGQPVWNDGGGTFNPDHCIPASKFFSGSQAVLVPKRVSTPYNFQMMAATYGQFLVDNFTIAGTNDCWTLFERNTNSVNKN